MNTKKLQAWIDIAQEFFVFLIIAILVVISHIWFRSLLDVMPPIITVVGGSQKGTY